MASNSSNTKRIVEILTARREHQEVGERLDSIGALLEAFILKVNGGTVTNQWADTAASDVAAARATPTLYVDAAGKAFAAPTTSIK